MISTPGAGKPAAGLHTTSQPLVPIAYKVPYVLVTVLFFLWAIPNNLNDILIRQFIKSFSLTRIEAGLVQSAFYLGYFVLAIPAALLMKKAGYKAGIIVGLCLFAVGCFAFWPAAILGSYAPFLVALFIIASGLSFLETAANPFIAQLGSEDTSERRLNLSQAFNPLGAITGGLIGTLFIFSGVELSPAQVAARKAAGTYRAYLQGETLRVVAPYIVLGALALVLVFILARTRFPTLEGEGEEGTSGEQPTVKLVQQGRFIKSVFAQFMYIGAQVGTWSYFIQYVQDSTHAPERTAGFLLTGTLVAFALGRFASAAIMRTVAPERLMLLYSGINLALVATGILAAGWFGVVALLLTSFFMSIMFPTIFALGIKDLGSSTKLAASILVMSIIGGAVWTPIMGFISEVSHSIAAAYVIPLVAYAVIAWFSWSVQKTDARAI